MASSSGKRLKTMATKRKEKEPEQPHSSRFLSRKHEKHFKVVQDRRLLMERKVGMIPNFAPQFGEQLLGNDSGKLATYPAPANIVVVKEFYTNAKKIGDYPAENYLGYVRGHAISRALFIYCAIRNLNVNIGQVIADEISVCANTSNNKAPLGHPSLITHLCKIAGVDTSAPPFERPRKAIDEAYYRQYCGDFNLKTTRVFLYYPSSSIFTCTGLDDTPSSAPEPVQGGGAEAAEALVREMEEDEADDDDALEDDEDEEEEEDIEDNSD
ncbi:hypothetical protein LR48_Vigan226s001000 [Vigna angularis]|uniref:Putative plant transposon protein domain-containing protein n=1 Tax=Phaseolus angularis TaxID=3914 RepID=A0A0L9T6W8_PHAAN|nr:hypothetical protein LR48_Vigan226s001000 [Vigna angularis]